MGKDTLVIPAEKLAKLGDRELDAEAERLAALRTDVRLAQNAITAEQEIRRATAGMSGATREAFLLRIGGDIKPTGDSSAEEVKA